MYVTHIVQLGQNLTSKEPEGAHSMETAHRSTIVVKPISIYKDEQASR